jgi:hypothetical protein
MTRYVGDEIWHPMADLLFTSDQLAEARRHDAVFEEYYAHLFAVLSTKRYLPSALAELTTAVGAATNRLRAREQLRLMRSRFMIPPYLFAELDARLRMRT